MAIDQVTGGLIKNDAITSAKLADNIELQGAQFKIPVHANDSARDSAIGSPAAGMMIFNTALGAVQQYSGTAWEKMSSPPQVSGLGAGQDGAINTDSTNVVTVSDCAKKDHEASLSVKLKSFAIILSNKKILLILITLINDENAIKIKAFHL